MDIPVTLRELRSLVAGRRATASVNILEIGDERTLTVEAQVGVAADDVEAATRDVDRITRMAGADA